MPIESKTRGTLDQSIQFRTTKVLCQARQFLDTNIIGHDAIRAHLVGMDIQNLDTPLFIGKGNLDVDLESAGSEERFVDHVQSVGHTDDKDIVQLLYAVHLMHTGQTLDACKERKTYF
jgi:hypothetical protein